MHPRVEELRRIFPHPVKAGDKNIQGTSYCVGGALCLSLGSVSNFPGMDKLALLLHHVNPLLTPQKAHHFAVKIIISNERDKFEQAWKAMSDALEWKP